MIILLVKHLLTLFILFQQKDLEYFNFVLKMINKTDNTLNMIHLKLLFK